MKASAFQNFTFYFSYFNNLKSSYSQFSSPGWSAIEWQSRRKAHLLTTLIIPCCCLASSHTARETPDLEAICWEFQILSVPLFQSIRPEREWQSTSFSSGSVVLGFPQISTPAWAEDQFPVISHAQLNLCSDFLELIFFFPSHWYLLCTHSGCGWIRLQHRSDSYSC